MNTVSIKIGSGESKNHLNIRQVTSNNTLLFDMHDGHNGNSICNNLTVAQARLVHSEIGKFLDRQPVTVTVTGTREAIAFLKDDPAFEIKGLD